MYGERGKRSLLGILLALVLQSKPCETSVPVFTSISPNLISAFGGNTLNISGSNFPSLASGSEILCEWQESLVLAGNFVSTQLIQCPVPSVFRFIDFSSNSNYTLDRLKVSFDIFTNVSAVVIGPSSSGPLALQVRLVSDELSDISIWPYRIFASAANLLVFVNWSKLPTTLPSAVPALCRFTLITSKGRYGKSVSVHATILNETTLECVAPTLAAIDARVQAPVDALVHISLDGGQTFSSRQTSFGYMPDITVSSLSPVEVLDTGGTWVTLYGSGFVNTASFSCKFTQASSSTEIVGGDVRFLNSSAVMCLIPFVNTTLPAGPYDVYVTVDGANYVDTGVAVTAIESPNVLDVYPSRGYYYGGTLVNVSGANIKNDSESTQCVFGNAPTRMYAFINSSFIQCLSPACTQALPGFPKDGDPTTCNGSVWVSVVTVGAGFSGFGIAGGSQFEYVAEQKILGFEPWYASSWDSAYSVRVFGKGFVNPLYCQWLNLPSILAANVTETHADCVAPQLPESYKPAVASGLDYLLGYVEVSCNDQDFTSDRRQWLFIEPPVVISVSPDVVWAGSVRTGGVFVYGQFFRAINLEALSCLWYYNGDDSVYETVSASFIDKGTVYCNPSQTVSMNARYVRVEVQVTPGIVSSSNVSLTVVDAPLINTVDSIGNLSGPYLGGDELTISGSNIDASSELVVVVGQTPTVVDYSLGGSIVVFVPPSNTVSSQDIVLVVNRQDRLVVGQYTYTTVRAGLAYRPAIDKGIAVPCRSGYFCGGGYPSNDSFAFTSMIMEQACPPGSYQLLSGATGCVLCKSPSYCPSSNQISPSSCPYGKVCWDRSGNDAELSICAPGKICLLDKSLALIDTIPLPEDPFRSLRQVFRLLSQSDPLVSGNNLSIIPCPAGFTCGPGTTGIGSNNTFVSFLSPSVLCTVVGIFCSPGASSPYDNSGIIQSGYYVSIDGYSLIQCPVGYRCTNGQLIACPPGTFQNIPGSSDCSACTAGTVCTSSASRNPSICPSGFVCSLPGRVQASYPCPAGSYCIQGTLSMIALPAGTDTTGDQQNSPVQCAQGTYCATGTNSDSPNPGNIMAPRLCAIGYYCGTGAQDYRGSGACPLGYYCPVGSAEPIPSPPGSYVDYYGAYVATLCAPGTYQDLEGSEICKECPDGYECASEGLTSPSKCPAAHYRSNSDSSFTASENVVCHPCQEGTWNWRGGLTSSSQCIVCPERYVCGRQGMSLFATKDETDCTPNSDNVSLCYELSQASDCPEGYACDAGTTSFTQYSYPCEAGYFCKPLTALREMRNLLCPAGFACKYATGVSQAYSYVCTPGSFCPPGTARGMIEDIFEYFENVQALSNFNSINATTGAVCKKCDPNIFNPPQVVDTTTCEPCGEYNEFIDTYVPVKDWTYLNCPDGTYSKRGSIGPEDCVQTGEILALVNMYNESQFVYNPRTNVNTSLWREDIEFNWISDPSSKQSYQYGTYLSETDESIVNFIAFDPRWEPELFFQSIPLQALDILRLDFDFSSVPDNLLMATGGNKYIGSYFLQISSNKQSDGSLYLLPHTLDAGNGSLHGIFTLKLTALENNVLVNVSLALLDGRHITSLSAFNSSVSISIGSPNRSLAGTPNTFYAIVASSVLNLGGYELPMNMVPPLANQRGDKSLVVDLGGLATNQTVDPIQPYLMIPGTVFWQIAGVSTVGLPWLPFFSNCDYFDKHIGIWDVLEGNSIVPLSAGQCSIQEFNSVRTVAPLIYNFDTSSMDFQPVADWCELALTCRYEDKLLFESGDPIPWMAMPGTGSSPLFYLTQDAWDPDITGESGFFDSLAGTDATVPVMLDASQRTGKFPRLVSLSINYAQLSGGRKQIVSGKVVFSKFDDDTLKTDYLLQISWEPMNWVQLMNNFVLPWYVYAFVFILVGLATAGIGVLAWLILRASQSGKDHHSPHFALADCYTFFMSYTLQGVLVATVPSAVLVLFIKLFTYPEIGLLNNIPCVWDRGPSSSQSSLPTESDDCQSVRTGTCLVVAGILSLWTASKYFAPRLPEAHEQFISNASIGILQEDGVLEISKKNAVKTVALWKRVHIFFTSLLVAVPLMVLYYLSYSAMFGSFTVFYSAGYTVTMLFFDLLYIKVARDKTTFNYLSVVTDVVFFVATLSAADLNAFVLSYFFGPILTVVQRLLAEDFISYVYSDFFPSAVSWIRSRKFFWSIILKLKRVVGKGEGENFLKNDSHVLKFTKVSEPVIKARAVKELGEIDDDIDQVNGVASRTASLVFAPFAILLVWVFATETQFAANYGLRLSSIPFYLLFSVIVIPFQIAMEIAVNHAFDTTRGSRIYDYMYLSMHRWRNRLTRWLLDDARLDSSMGESTQALHHLAFSPQFYFIVTVAVYGGVFVTYGITCWIANGVAGFLDPATAVFGLLTLVAQRFSDAIGRWLVFYLMWRPADRAPEKAFVQSIALGMKQMELEEHQVTFRNLFFQKHREWIIKNLEKVYTPRGIGKYRSQLNEIYHKVLSIRIPYLYTAPVKRPTEFVIEEPSDEVAEDLKKKETELFEVPLDSDDDEFVGNDAPITYSLVQGWLEVARRRVRRARMAKKSRPVIKTSSKDLDDESTENFAGFINVNMTETSKTMMKEWIKNARAKLHKR